MLFFFNQLFYIELTLINKKNWFIDMTRTKSGFANMFSSHPDMLKRIKLIKEMAEKDGHVLDE